MNAKMLIGAKWFRCDVERIDDIPHWSGNPIRRFTCRFSNGDVICCARNSIKFNPSPAPAAAKNECK